MADGEIKQESAELSEVTRDEASALFAYLREAVEQLEVVNRVVAAVNSSRSMEEVFRLASEHMRALLPFDRASIALREEDGEQLRVFAVSGEHAGTLMAGAVGRLPGSVTEYALAQREIILIPDLGAETRFIAYDDLHREGYRSAVCCPLFSAARAIGSLNLTSRTPAAYGRKEVLALERLAPPFALALEKALLLEQAERRSREMEAAARREELAGRIGRRLAAMLDPPAVLQETVSALGRALAADRCHITLFDAQDEYALVEYEYLGAGCEETLRGYRLPLRGSAHARRALVSDDAVLLNEFASAERDELLELYARLNVRAVLTAPVRAGEAARGLLEVHRCAGGQNWTEEDAKLLRLVASQVSLALTNAQLYEASRRRNEELQGLYEISRLFSTVSDSADLYERLTRAIAELLGAEMCLVAAYDRRRNLVRAEAPGYNTPPEVIRAFNFELEAGNHAAPVYKTGEVFFSNEPAQDARFNRRFVERFGIRSVLSVPLRIKGGLIGFIYVANRPGGFHERDAQLLEIFAQQAAETIGHSRLFATVQAQAEREAVINRLLLSLQRISDPREAMRAVIERVGQALDLDRCIATLFAKDARAEIYGQWCAPGVAAITDMAEVRERSPIPDWLIEHRRPLVADSRAHPLAQGMEDLIAKIGLKSFVVVPIIHQGRVIGSLSAHQTQRERHWIEDDIDLLTAVAVHVSATLENARLIAELREANRLKDDFLATLSHELRTPLAAISGWVGLLEENSALRSDEELTDGISVIKDAARALSQMISDLLDLSRLQRRALHLERAPCDINLTVLSTAQAARPALIAQRLELQLALADDLPTLAADQQRIHQVLWNLLANAIKFTPAGGRLTIRTRVAEGEPAGEVGEVTTERDGAAPAPSAQARWVVIEVADTGEGIPAEFLPVIWERFRQADGSSTRKHGGLGIGLALVKELVEAHGGEVSVTSGAGGSTFIVRLPLTAES